MDKNLPKQMQLDEAISHCEEIASENCNDCGNEHSQLACWLKELKERRKQSGWIKTAGQLPENGQFVLAYCCIDRPAYGLVEYTDFGEGLTCWTDPGTGNTFPIGMFTHWKPIERPYTGEDHKKDIRDYNLKMLTGQEWGRE